MAEAPFAARVDVSRTRSLTPRLQVSPGAPLSPVPVPSVRRARSRDGQPQGSYAEIACASDAARRCCRTDAGPHCTAPRQQVSAWCPCSARTRRVCSPQNGTILVRATRCARRLCRGPRNCCDVVQHASRRCAPCARPGVSALLSFPTAARGAAADAGPDVVAGSVLPVRRTPTWAAGACVRRFRPRCRSGRPGVRGPATVDGEHSGLRASARSRSRRHWGPQRGLQGR